MYLKIHRIQGTGGIVAVCDRDLLNRTLRHGEIEICVSEKFYGNEEAGRDEVVRALKSAGNINLIGKKAVSVAIECGVLAEGAYMLIEGVPHAQIYQA